MRSKMKLKQGIKPDAFVTEIDPRILNQLESLLNINSAWKKVLAAIKKKQYVFKDTDIADMERANGTLHGSSAAAMLNRLSSRAMKIESLARVFDQLQMERELELLREPEPLVFVCHPVSYKEVPEGNAVELEVEAYGFPYPRYQWYADIRGRWTRLDGQNKAVFNIMNIRACDSGGYVCHINNMANQRGCQSNKCTLQVIPNPCLKGTTPAPIQDSPEQDVFEMSGHKPAIEVQPEMQQAVVRDPVTLSCKVKAHPPARYQWYKDGKLLPGEVYPNLHFKQSEFWNQGKYWCEAYNQHGQTVSQVAELFIARKMPGETPYIIKQPKSMVAEIGAVVHFDIEVNGQEPLHYQWLFEGHQIPGAKSRTLSVRVASKEDSGGTYQCVVSCPRYGTMVHSKVATLNILLTKGQTFTAVDKVALIIGNSQYKSRDPLNAVQAEILSIQEKLEELEFRVLSFQDLNKSEMETVIDVFSALLTEGMYGVFFFGGHGFSVGGSSYMMPYDIVAGNPRVSDCVSLGSVLERMQRRNPALNLLITDMCKQYLPSGEGIQDYIPHENVNWSPGKTILLYSTSSGGKAYNIAGQTTEGVFVTALCRALENKMSLMDMFKHIQKDVISNGDSRILSYPQLDYNLIDDRTLHDNISFTGHTTEIDKRTVLWERANEIPVDEEKQFVNNMVVRLHYQRIFSNKMYVVTTVYWPKELALKNLVVSLEGVPVRLTAYKLGRPEDTCIDITSDGVGKMEVKHILQDLQRLEDQLNTVITLKWRTMDGVMGAAQVPLPMGMPLAGLFSSLIEQTKKELHEAQMRQQHQARQYNHVPYGDHYGHLNQNESEVLYDRGHPGHRQYYYVHQTHTQGPVNQCRQLEGACQRLTLTEVKGTAEGEWNDKGASSNS